MIFTINGLKDKKFMIISKKVFFKLTKFKKLSFFRNYHRPLFLFFQMDGTMTECLCPVEDMEKFQAYA